MATTHSVAGSKNRPYNFWLEQLMSKDGKISLWSVDTVVDVLFPPYGLLASIYTHVVDTAQPDSEYHTLSHDVVFTMTLSKALRMTKVEMQRLLLSYPRLVGLFVCYSGTLSPWTTCPQHYHHDPTTVTHHTQKLVLCEAIGTHGDWFLMFKMFPELFEAGLGSAASSLMLPLSSGFVSLLMECCKYACQAGELRMVKFLSSLQTHKDNGGKSTSVLNLNAGLIQHAAKSGNAALVSYLIGLGEDINISNASERRAIHYAFDNADTEVLSVLLKAPGCRVEVEDDTGVTPMHLAANYGRCKAIQLLADAGVDMADCVDDCSSTPLHYAASNDHGDAVALLVKLGCSIEGVNYQGETALHTAASLGSAAALGSLLTCGASVNPISKAGWTPLAYAQKQKNEECVALLIAAGGTD